MLLGKFLITVSILALVIGLFKFSISLWFLSKNLSISSPFTFYWHTIVHSSLLTILGMPVESMVASLFFISNSFESSPSFSILFIFSKSWLLVSLIFTVVFFVSVLFLL